LRKAGNDDPKANKNASGTVDADSNSDKQAAASKTNGAGVATPGSKLPAIVNIALKPSLKKNNYDDGAIERGFRLGGKNEDMMSIGVNSQEELAQIKAWLKTPVGTIFNTNVMRVALNMQEERIASLLIAYYNVRIDEEMILRAIKTA
jgi:hypothetical protein